MQVLSQRLHRLSLTFPKKQTVPAICVYHRVELATALDELGLRRSRPTLVLTGGANHLGQQAARRLKKFFRQCLVPLAEELQLTVIDGGTDSGVMRLMGQGRSAHKATFPLVGVAPACKVHLPQDVPSSGTYPLEPHHTHFILIPGAEWGTESPWIAQLATAIAGTAPSLTILINGGSVSLIDVQASLAEHRPVCVMAGTGRLADEIATAIRSPHTPIRPELEPVLQAGCQANGLSLMDWSKPTRELVAAFRERLTQSSGFPPTNNPNLTNPR
ncbi:hypothetical protein C7B61_21185 [filamentous cyanobacterium CCP1]|nr:hypothetical protein C7B76_21425 [filamentous cyanobacterium CCP2]PSB55595.1 hypothetical protein C7B61_21185 [filamentous cyanobacterium CCP1]